MLVYCFFFFNDTATTEIYTLSLHDALPICLDALLVHQREAGVTVLERGEHVLGAERRRVGRARLVAQALERSEEHTSELQSRQYLVCRLLLEKKKKKLYYESCYSS